MKCFFLLTYLIENSRKSSVKTEESPRGRLLWLETQILQDSPGKHCKDVAASFQSAILSQVLIQDMQFSCLPKSRLLSSSWLRGRRMRPVPGAKTQSSSTPPCTPSALPALQARYSLPKPLRAHRASTVCVALETSVLLSQI